MNFQSCGNLNHRKSEPPVYACPQCGGVVNARIGAARCSLDAHASRRKEGDAYCLNCAAPLRQK